MSFSPHIIEMSPEGVKWELGFARFGAAKMGFYQWDLGFHHWDWDSQTKKQLQNGNAI